MKEIDDIIQNSPLPSSTEIERQVIADIVSCQEAVMPDARRLLNDEMFADENCLRAWRSLCSMDDRGETIDLTTALSVLDTVYFTQKIIPKTITVGTASTVIGHCITLARLSVRRKTYLFAVRLLQECVNNEVTLEKLVAMPEDFSRKLRTDLNADKDSVGIGKVLNDLADSIGKEQNDRQQGRKTRVPTGFPTLDTMTYGGFNAGNLIVLAARPSVGKTSVMLQMARAAADSGIPVTVFSLEMMNQELAQRLLFSTGIVKPADVASGKMKWEDFEAAAACLYKCPICMNDSARTVEDIVTRIILNYHNGKCGIAFVDYLGLIDTRAEGRTPLYQIIASITKRLKQVAKDCKIPVVLLSQLNRASASDKRPPQLYDLRDSGSIEQDADTVLMLERPDSDPDQQDTSPLNMWVRKNRHGKAGNYYIELRADPTYTNFSDLGAKRV